MPPLQNRIESLDQFRGYTVAGMFLVNYLSGFWAAPFVCHHHNTYCSYADTIMPGFFFAVGFSMRLSFGRREHDQGLPRAYWHMVKRLLGLALVAIFIAYVAKPNMNGETFDWHHIKGIGVWKALHDPLKNTWFQTLMHIAVTSLWILPVLRMKPIWRILYMILSAAIHLGLSNAFYFDWVNGYLNGHIDPPSGIDGGNLGFLTWTIPTIIGTLACDTVMTPRGRVSLLARLFGWGAVLMAFGWLASCATRMYDVPADEVQQNASMKLAKSPVIPSKEQFEKWTTNLKAHRWPEALAEPPFVPPPHSHDPDSGTVNQEGLRKTEDKSDLYRKANYWMMSQRAGTISYLTFAAGFSLALYGLFYILSDMIGIKVGMFRTFGTNALVGYILHDFTADAIKNFIPNDSPPLVMWASVVFFFYITWLFIRSLEKRNIYLKL
jgi:predicted acyltransferase